MIEQEDRLINSKVFFQFQTPEDRSIFIQILESVYRFTLGSAAGGRLIIYIRCNM